MYEQIDFSSLIGLEGFSDVMLNNHFTLYGGYVKQTNGLAEKLPTLPKGTPEYNELSRRFGWEFNGMRLHELYFENMSKTPGTFDPESELAICMTKSFGEAKLCGEDFTKRASLRGIGWVVSYYDAQADRIFNVWIDEHGTNHLTGCTPLVVMDMWEHAFMTDYGLDKAGYIDAFKKGIDWDVVNKRFASAASAS